MSVQTAYFFTMDSFAESTVITREANLGREANETIKEICAEIEGRISHRLATSEIYRLNSRENFELSEETVRLLELAGYMSKHTNGAFNPNLGEIINLWGFSDHQIENARRTLPEVADFFPALERAQNHTGAFDLGAIGKGHAIDAVSSYLAETGIPNALVSVGGSSVLAMGRNQAGNLWAVGIKDPIDPDPERPSGFISATDKVISVSGGYHRYININGIDYVHIIDPATGYPVDNDLLCVVVIMNSQSAFHTAEQRERLKNNGAVSDALSTALYVMGKDEALRFYNSTHLDFEMILFVRDDDSPRGYDIIMTSVIFTELDHSEIE
jgi:thiamine biosynthesis lipoprotein